MELVRLSGFSNGGLSYHLAILEKSEVIRADRLSRVTRYFPANFSDKEAMLLRSIRNNSASKIVLILLEMEQCTFGELVKLCRKAPSTVSSHLKRLRESGVISVVDIRPKTFALSDSQAIAELIGKYGKMFAQHTSRHVPTYDENSTAALLHESDIH
jgi:predicted transcriptional regulator